MNDQRSNYLATIIHETATIGIGALVRPGAYIGESAVIGDHCIIEESAIIHPRVRLGHHVIVRQGSVVMRDVEPDRTSIPWIVVAGNPAKVTGTIPRTPPTKYPIPINSRAAPCRKCGVRVYTITMPNGFDMPVNPDGVPHWYDCRRRGGYGND